MGMGGSNRDSGDEIIERALCYRTIGEGKNCIMGALWAVKAERGAANRRTRGGVKRARAVQAREASEKHGCGLWRQWELLVSLFAC